MSTRSSIKYSRPDDAPGFHLFDDVMDSFAAVDGDPEPPVYLELFDVQAELTTDGYVHVAIPRAMARELGLLPTSDGVTVPDGKGPSLGGTSGADAGGEVKND